MGDMPRPRPPHLHRQTTRYGKTVWYVRVGKGPRIRIRSELGTPEFDMEYQAAMRGVLKWALNARLVKADPTIGVGNPASKKGDGFIPWTEEHVEKYEARWPIGTRQRVWLDVMLYTGLRRGDAVRLGRQHIKDGIATLKTEKSQFTVEVTLPILPALARTLQAGPCGDLTFIAARVGGR